MSEAPVLPKLLTNRTKNGHYVLTYKNVWDPKKRMPKRIAAHSIGKIYSEDGLGEVIFSEKFLKQSPEWVDYRVTKVGKGQYTVEKRHYNA